MKRLLRDLLVEIELKTILVAALFIVSLFVFGYLAHEVVGENETGFDERVFNLLAPFKNPRFIYANRVLSFFGSTIFVIPAYIVIIVLLWFLRRRSDAINVTIIAVSSTLLMLLLKQIFHRHRPDLPLVKTLTNFSFPSGHALCSFIFCSAMIYLIDKGRLQLKWKWLFSVLLILLAIAIGISRIVLRYHYATDVLAGFCVGFAWVIFSLWLEKKLTPHRVQMQLDSQPVS